MPVLPGRHRWSDRATGEITQLRLQARRDSLQPRHDALEGEERCGGCGRILAETAEAQSRLRQQRRSRKADCTGKGRRPEKCFANAVDLAEAARALLACS